MVHYVWRMAAYIESKRHYRTFFVLNSLVIDEIIEIKKNRNFVLQLLLIE